MRKKIKPMYIPTVKSSGDVSNFDDYPDSGSYAQDIKTNLDPFLNWWLLLSEIYFFFIWIRIIKLCFI